MNQVNIAVSEEQTSERLDKFLSTTEPEWSRTQVQQWVKDGLIEVNGKQVKYQLQSTSWRSNQSGHSRSRRAGCRSRTNGS